MAPASPWAGLEVTIATHGANPMATASPWAGLEVTIATHGANPMATASLWEGLRVAMATLKGRSQSHGNSIPEGGTWVSHGNPLSQSHRCEPCLFAVGFVWGVWAWRRLPWRSGVPIVVVVLSGDEDDDGEDGAQHGGGHADGQRDEGEIPRLPRGHLGLGQVPPSHRRANLSN